MLVQIREQIRSRLPRYFSFSDFHCSQRWPNADSSLEADDESSQALPFSYENFICIQLFTHAVGVSKNYKQDLIWKIGGVSL